MPRKGVLPPPVGPLEPTEELIRIRAYQLFEQRGYQHGRDVDDWLQAEAEVMGKKPGSSPDQRMKVRAATAA